MPVLPNCDVVQRLGTKLARIFKMAAVSSELYIFLFLFILSKSANVHGWDSTDLELFDLVEEVKVNFYDVLGLQQVRFTFV